jgi:hypothetical protein
MRSHGFGLYDLGRSRNSQSALTWSFMIQSRQWRNTGSIDQGRAGRIGNLLIRWVPESLGQATSDTVPSGNISFLISSPVASSTAHPHDVLKGSLREEHDQESASRTRVTLQALYDQLLSRIAHTTARDMMACLWVECAIYYRLAS